MNERIKKIAERATVYREGLVDGKYDIEFFDKEKFAELIVKECATVITDVLEDGPWPGKLLKEHFGVKE
jgi:ABC-type uncharacterized transport system ATPase subunit